LATADTPTTGRSAGTATSSFQAATAGMVANTDQHGLPDQAENSISCKSERRARSGPAARR
jgi:hypothetical protein